MGLVSELRRRNVFRMAVLYIVAAWLIMQVAEVLAALLPELLPEWLGQVTVAVLVIGFPIALILSWFYEITPEGVSLEKDVEPGESITHITGRRLDLIVISLLSAAVILFAVHTWWLPEPPERSVAVLPFANMSDDPGNEYFSDGISEEILNLLSQVPELLVISRSSAFSFKGQNVDLPTIADKLNVAHILEGSVRKSGDQLRITAQLIEAESNRHLWSKSFDRELEDVFAIQDEIAEAVVDALKITLLDEQPKAVETDPEAYRLYLQAQQLMRQNDPQVVDRVLPLLNEALQVDPDFAPAWAEMAYFHANFIPDGPVDFHQVFNSTQGAARKTLDLDPDNGLAQAMLAFVEMQYDWNWVAAEEYIDQALELDPANDRVLVVAAELSLLLHRADEAIELAERSVTQDPINVTNRSSLRRYLGYNDEWTRALEQERIVCELISDTTGCGSAAEGYILLQLGDTFGALAAVENTPDEPWRLIVGAMAQHALGDTQASDTALEALIELYQEGYAFQIAMVYGFRNEPDSAFFWLERCHEQHDPGLPYMRIQRELANLHNDPRWGRLLEKIGFVE